MLQCKNVVLEDSIGSRCTQQNGRYESYRGGCAPGQTDMTFGIVLPNRMSKRRGGGLRVKQMHDQHGPIHAADYDKICTAFSPKN